MKKRGKPQKNAPKISNKSADAFGQIQKIVNVKIGLKQMLFIIIIKCIKIFCSRIFLLLFNLNQTYVQTEF